MNGVFSLKHEEIKIAGLRSRQRVEPSLRLSVPVTPVPPEPRRPLTVGWPVPWPPLVPVPARSAHQHRLSSPSRHRFPIQPPGRNLICVGDDVRSLTICLLASNHHPPRSALVLGAYWNSVFAFPLSRFPLLQFGICST
jgi:hypothetical protein